MPSHSLDVLGRLRPVVPASLVGRAEAWVEGSVPAEPLPSASVILLRSSPEGELETYLLHRHARMPYAASMVAFPGGRVEAADHTWPGVDPFRACAVRETQEETGARLQPNELWEWAHWTTPAFEPRRYDTRFFVAELPVGQEADDRSGETDLAGWERPAAVVAAAEVDEIALLPPTLAMLTELADAGAVEAVLAAAVDRVVEPVLPQLVHGPDGWQFRYPVRGADP